ncbi:hypothetical protein Vretimale_15516 [Volvox reticuliferus]|uniref:Uncharacterized protein n=1 Tax=Volvox reticuliferus TaxID=1737510 RepID=A0A8J4CNS9_9CHLO|nr:hypothetical protein Vretifemale_15158 [Volvox reticuliferus]GIM12086.1 hypothetical protein Vretimale_15516 [Volvox reticuliferus]
MSLIATPLHAGLHFTALLMHDSVSEDVSSAFCTRSWRTSFTSSSTGAGPFSESNLAGGGSRDLVLRSLSFQRPDPATRVMFPRTLSSSGPPELRLSGATASSEATPRTVRGTCRSLHAHMQTVHDLSSTGVGAALSGWIDFTRAELDAQAEAPAAGGVSGTWLQYGRVSRAVQIKPRRSRSQTVIQISGASPPSSSSSSNNSNSGKCVLVLPFRPEDLASSAATLQ